MRSALTLNTHRILLLLGSALLFFQAVTGAQESRSLPPVLSRSHEVGTDSVQVIYAYPEIAAPAPLLVILPDRFGIHRSVEKIVAVSARLGFRAVAIPLRSAPTRPVSGAPTAQLDSSDIARVSQIVIDFLNEPGCTGKAGLFAFDIGAAVGATVAMSLPLFKSCVFLYPHPPAIINGTIASIPVPVSLTVCDSLSDASMLEIDQLRESPRERKHKIRVNVLRGTAPFFFNQLHERYRKKTMNQAWVDAVAFFRSTLRNTTQVQGSKE